MNRKLSLIVLASIVIVALLGYVAMPGFRTFLGLDAKDVRATVLSAAAEDVVLPDSGEAPVKYIVTELELIFPYGGAPDNIADLSVRDVRGQPVNVNWGVAEPQKLDLKNTTKLFIRRCFFPADFKQGMLWHKDKSIASIKMPGPLDPSVVILSAIEQDDAIVAEMEISVPYGTAPENFTDLTVRDDDENLVKVDWGEGKPQKFDTEGRAATKIILRECHFPYDFKQGKLWNRDKPLLYIKMPKPPFNAPTGK